MNAESDRKLVEEVTQAGEAVLLDQALAGLVLSIVLGPTTGVAEAVPTQDEVRAILKEDDL